VKKYSGKFCLSPQTDFVSYGYGFNQIGQEPKFLIKKVMLPVNCRSTFGWHVAITMGVWGRSMLSIRRKYFTMFKAGPDLP